MLQRGIIIDRYALEEWSGRSLSDDEVARLEKALPHSTLPDTIATIVDSFES